MSYENWDWDEAAKRTSPESLAWLKNAYRQKLSYEQFAEARRSLPHDHPHPGRCVAPSRMRYQYNYFKTKYGFFTGELA